MKIREMKSIPLRSEKRRYKEKEARKALVFEYLLLFVLILLIVGFIGLWICQEIEINYLNNLSKNLEWK